MKILTGRKIVLGYKKKKPRNLSASVSYICTALYLECSLVGSFEIDTNGILWLEVFPGFKTGIQSTFRRSALHPFSYLIYLKIKGRTGLSRIFGEAWIKGFGEVEVYENPT